MKKNPLSKTVFVCQENNFPSWVWWSTSWLLRSFKLDSIRTFKRYATVSFSFSLCFFLFWAESAHNNSQNPLLFICEEYFKGISRPEVSVSHHINQTLIQLVSGWPCFPSSSSSERGLWLWLLLFLIESTCSPAFASFSCCSSPAVSHDEKKDKIKHTLRFTSHWKGDRGEKGLWHLSTFELSFFVSDDRPLVMVCCDYSRCDLSKGSIVQVFFGVWSVCGPKLIVLNWCFSRSYVQSKLQKDRKYCDIVCIVHTLITYIHMLYWNNKQPPSPYRVLFPDPAPLNIIPPPLHLHLAASIWTEDGVLTAGRDKQWYEHEKVSPLKSISYVPSKINEGLWKARQGIGGQGDRGCDKMKLLRSRVERWEPRSLLCFLFFGPSFFDLHPCMLVCLLLSW